MDEWEKSRNPFEKFIDKLEALNGLKAPDETGEESIIERANTYAQVLANKYGLPKSDEILAFAAELIEMAISTELQLGPVRGAYLNMILWDTIQSNPKRPLEAMKVAVLYGFCLHILMELDAEVNPDV